MQISSIKKLKKVENFLDFNKRKERRAGGHKASKYSSCFVLENNERVACIVAEKFEEDLKHMTFLPFWWETQPNEF